MFLKLGLSGNLTRIFSKKLKSMSVHIEPVPPVRFSLVTTHDGQMLVHHLWDLIANYGKELEDIDLTTLGFDMADSDDLLTEPWTNSTTSIHSSVCILTSLETNKTQHRPRSLMVYENGIQNRSKSTDMLFKFLEEKRVRFQDNSNLSNIYSQIWVFYVKLVEFWYNFKKKKSIFLNCCQYVAILLPKTKLQVATTPETPLSLKWATFWD
jgi:hypothetical protein